MNDKDWPVGQIISDRPAICGDFDILTASLSIPKLGDILTGLEKICIDHGEFAFYALYLYYEGGVICKSIERKDEICEHRRRSPSYVRGLQYWEIIRFNPRTH